MKPLVENLEQGTVIDHIPPEVTFQVWDLLGKKQDIAAIGNYFSSKRMGKKGIIKIANKILTQEEVNRIAILAPHATVSVIRKGIVDKKYTPRLPSLLNNVIACINPNCVTKYQHVPTKFRVLPGNPLKVQCVYCELLIKHEEIVLV